MNLQSPFRPVATGLSISAVIALCTPIHPVYGKADDQVASPSQAAEYQSSVDECIAAWGKSSPFHRGDRADLVMTGGVKVFGIGSSDSNAQDATSKPQLVLVRPAVNVLGANTLKLMNPNGWYCFKSNVSVLGKITIEAHCDAHLANATGSGANVLGADESKQGVTVLGTLRIKRFGCLADKKVE